MDFEILEKLNAFTNVEFEEKRHIYTIGKQQLTSVTTLLKKFSPDKDWQEIAEKYAAKNGETAEHWQKQWKQEGTIGREKGSEFHLYAEMSLANKVHDFDMEKMVRITEECDLVTHFEPYRAMKKMKMMWDVFWLQAQGVLIPVRSEFVMGDAELGIGGMIDQLFWNTKMQELQIWDWKTNKKIGMSNKFQNFKAPIQYLDECEYNTYSLQIGIYKYIFEKNVGIKIGTCYIGHFHELNDTYKIIKARDMSKEVELILNVA